MVRFLGLLAAAALAAATVAGPAAMAQSDLPQEIGPLDTGPLQAGPAPTKPKKAKATKTTLQKRAAKKPVPAGRNITVHARPSWLTAGTQVPVGTVGNGYVYDTFAQPTPNQGTFTGMRGRERITDPLGNAAPGLTLFRF